MRRAERLRDQLHAALAWMEAHEGEETEDAETGRREFAEWTARLWSTSEGVKEQAHLTYSSLWCLEWGARAVVGGKSVAEGAMDARTMLEAVSETIASRLRTQREMWPRRLDTPLAKRLRALELEWVRRRGELVDAMTESGLATPVRRDAEQLLWAEYRQEREAMQNALEPHEELLHAVVAAWAEHLQSEGSKAPKWKTARALLAHLLNVDPSDIPNDESLRKGFDAWKKDRANTR